MHVHDESSRRGQPVPACVQHSVLDAGENALLRRTLPLMRSDAVAPPVSRMTPVVDPTSRPRVRAVRSAARRPHPERSSPPRRLRPTDRAPADVAGEPAAPQRTVADRRGPRRSTATTIPRTSEAPLSSSSLTRIASCLTTRMPAPSGVVGSTRTPRLPTGAHRPRRCRPRRCTRPSAAPPQEKMAAGRRVPRCRAGAPRRPR